MLPDFINAQNAPILKSQLRDIYLQAKNSLLLNTQAHDENVAYIKQLEAHQAEIEAYNEKYNIKPYVGNYTAFSLFNIEEGLNAHKQAVELQSWFDAVTDKLTDNPLKAPAKYWWVCKRGVKELPTLTNEIEQKRKELGWTTLTMGRQSVQMLIKKGLEWAQQLGDAVNTVNGFEVWLEEWLGITEKK